MSKPREFKFTIHKTEYGFDAVWDGDCLRKGKFHVIEKSYANALKASCDELIKALYDISIYPKGVPPDQPQPSKIEYAMADLADAAMAKYEEHMERLK